MKKPKKPGSYRCQRYGILNPHGDVWTPDTFNTMAAARQHLENFWRGHDDRDLSKFTVVPVKVVVTAVT